MTTNRGPTVIVMLGMKGGTGKSTVAIHLAVAAAQAGRSVTLIDTDPQASAMRWAAERQAPAPKIVEAHARDAAKHLNHGADLAVIDTAPRAEADITRLAEL